MNHEDGNESALRRDTVDEDGSWYYHKPNTSVDLSTSVVLAVSDALGADVENLHPPLYEIVNPDGLNSIFDTPKNTGKVSVVVVQLDLWGREITIYNDGWIVIGHDHADDIA